MSGDQLDGRPRVLDWGDPPGYVAVAPDGTRYELADDWVRGERRYWGFRVVPPGASLSMRSDKWWKPLDERGDQYAGSPNKQTVRNRAERHAKRFHVRIEGPSLAAKDRAARVLVALAERGPMTRREILDSLPERMTRNDLDSAVRRLRGWGAVVVVESGEHPWKLAVTKRGQQRAEQHIRDGY